MAKSDNRNFIFKPITNPQEVIVGKEVWIRTEENGKFNSHTIRPKIQVDHVRGFHIGETDIEYKDYRDTMIRWLQKGYLFNRITRPIKEVIPEPVKVIKTRKKVAVEVHKSPEMGSIVFKEDLPAYLIEL